MTSGDSDSLLPGTGLSDLLDAAVRRAGDRAALDLAGHVWTYRELGDLVAQASDGLRRMGVGPGSRVGLCLPNSPWYVIGFFAALRLSAIVVQFNPLYTAREIVQIARDSGTDTLFVSDLSMQVATMAEVRRQRPGLAIIGCPLDVASAGAMPSDWRDFGALIAEASTCPAVPVTADMPAVLQYTGGTTGVPKGAVLTHGNLLANCEQIRLHLHLEPDADHRTVAVLPLFHVFALTTVLLLSVRLAAQIVLLPRFDVDGLLRTIARTRPTLLSAVPTIYGAVNGVAVEQLPDFSTMAACISGGAPLPFDVREAFERRTGTRLVEGYGLTEASPVVACNPVDAPPCDHSAGIALPGTRIEIHATDEARGPLGPGEIGEVCVRGPQVMRGYWQQPEETARVLQDGLLRTGDVGYLDAEGHLFLVDRIKDVILCSGYNVYPRMIEEALYEHPAVAEAIALGLPDAYRGESPHAFVALRPGAEASVAGLRAHLAERLNKIEMPVTIEIRAALPRTAVGKLSRKDLRETVRAEAARAADLRVDVA
ncbi:long-chain fatty acid--CoA ligase [Sphingomonadaceae bacterium jetA1]|uniref:long-chain-fatty-acid--CoA ligase n=1 Tax=Facivitalis istanbulensis TaxID=3075838 RepID=UPI003474C101